MTEMPDFIRRALEAQGKYDPAEIAAKAGTEVVPPDQVEIERQHEEADWRAALPDEKSSTEETNQEPLFDADASRAARDRSMAQVERAADPDWKIRAMLAIDTLCERGLPFTADDVWEEVGEFPEERRALGPMLMQAAKSGRIRNTGRRRNSTRPEHHACPLTIWMPSE